jgi:hypothetical protein
VAIALVVSGALVIPSAFGTPGPPLSIAALGSADSAGACTDPSCADRPQNSWSTGTNLAVDSHRLRLKRLVGGIRDARFRQPIRAYTLATSRFKTVADLAAQARQLIRVPARQVTIDVGVGDLCSGKPLRTFRHELAKALAIVSRPSQIAIDGLGPPVGRQILTVSIEDLARHWRVLRADPAGVRALKAHNLDCGLGYDVSPARLAQIRQRTLALNDIIARLCFNTPGCLYDAGTRFRMPVNASYFSAADPRYLSIKGQRAVAAAEWKPALALIDAWG